MRNSKPIETDGNASGAERDRGGSGVEDPGGMNKTSARPVVVGLVALVGLVTLVVAVAFFAYSGARKASRPAHLTGRRVALATSRDAKTAAIHTRAFPSAAEFADAFVGAADEYSKAQGDPARISRPDCVQAAPGQYMCSYVVVKPGAVSECHLMQARWTPHAASTITVTLAGRTTRCGSLREALDSLP
jgi:hypothetical protein